MTVLKSASVVLAVAAMWGLSSCGSKPKKTQGGLEYEIVKDEKGTNKPGVGDIVEMHMHVSYKDGKTDTTLFDSRKMNNNNPIPFPLPAPTFRGDVTEGFMMLTPGDSAIFRVSVDSIKKTGAQLPDFMKSGTRIEYRTVLVSVKKASQAREEQEQKSKEQVGKDEALLQEYFTKNNLKPEKTPSGMYYIIEKQGAGAKAQNGQMVTVNYTGRTLDGTIFDSNTDAAFHHAEPFKFLLGAGQVIRGWDEGVALMNKGSKGKLFIPSGMAYGPSSPNPKIPANAVLTFDIEVTDISDAPKQAGVPAQ